MRKLFYILTLILATSFVGVAQDRTATTVEELSSQTRVKYTGLAADTLTANQDSMYINFQVFRDEPYQLDLVAKFDTIAGADTTVVIQVYGKKFYDSSWSLITTGTSGAVTTDDVIKEVSYSGNKTVALVMDTTSTYVTGTGAAEAYLGTLTETSKLLWYRYLQVRLILSGDDSVGDGVKLEYLEMKLWPLN